jgi:serine/threonine protein kinase/uncharacterized membrane protein
VDQPIQTDVELLKKLLLGQLPVAEAERLSQTYADDSRLAELAEAVGKPDDTLLTDLRNHQTQADPNADRLIDRLKQRLRGAVSQASAFSDTVGVTGDPSAPVQALPEFLEYFRIQKVLGEGGMGTVYLADDTRLGRKVALKTLKRELAVNPAAKDRFLREARSAAQLEHDHVIPIHYVGEANGIPFLAMPFLQGEPLDVRIRREQSSGNLLPISETVRIVGQIASGLAVAHARGLIHRDIKPANIWLEAPSGRVKILDFGLARSQSDEAHLTVSGTILGTPAYMAPEQARGLPVDHRADLFSLGCILYEMLTGNRPFTGCDTMAILSSLALDNPPAPNEVNLHCPESLSKLTMQMLEKQLERRTASAKVIVDALAKMGASNSNSTSILGPNPFADIDTPDHTQQLSEIAPKLASQTTPRKRRRVPVFAIGVLLALIGVGIAFSGTIFRLATNQGELVIEVDDKDVEVKIVQNGVVVQDKTNKREFTLTAGKGEIEVVDRDGLKVTTKTFELTRNGKTTVRVTVGELADARKPTPKIEPQPVKSSDPDRTAAEYVLSIGGVVRINDQDRVLKKLAELPKEQFTLSTIYLGDNLQVSDAGLAHFKGCKNLTHLHLHYTQASDAGLAHFKDCNNLTYLHLSGTKVGDAGLGYFKDCKKLTDLQLGETQVSDAGLAHFKDCKNLTDLHLGGTKVSDVGLAYFKDCKNLTGLNLHHTKVSEVGLAHFKDCKNLTQLSLSYAQVNDAGLAHFNDCKNLTQLGLDGTKASDAGLAYFKDCKNLTFLNLSNTEVSDAGLGQIKDHKNLTSLRLGETKVTAAGIDELKKALPKCKIEWDGGVVEPKQSSDPDRKAAEYVLSIGGEVGVNEKSQPVKGIAALPREAFRLTSISLFGNLQVNDAGLAVFKDCKKLTGLCFYDTKVTDAGLAYFKDCKTLLQLDLTNTKTTDAGLAHFADCSRLTNLNLFGTKVTDAGMAHFEHCKDLNYLLLDFTSVGDVGLAHFKDCKNLTYLGLAGTKLTDVGLAYFKDCKNLAKLLLHETQVTDAALVHLKEFQNLSVISVRKTKWTVAGIESLKKALPKCKIEWDGGVVEPTQSADPDRAAAEWVLSIGSTCIDDHDRELKNIAELPKEHFTLSTILLGSNSKVSDAALAHLKGCKNLKQLVLHNTQVSDAGLAHFQDCKTLTYLHLHNTQVGDAGLAHFKDCKNLTFLHLAGTKASDVGLAHFQDCKNLTDLRLQNTQVGDAGLDHLVKLKSLNHVDLRATKVTAEGVKTLATALPKCKIEWDGGVIEPKASLDPDRGAAEYVLSIGGAVGVNGEDRFLS